MKVTIAYIEEPPFGWTESGQGATGADIELAEKVLTAIGVTSIKHHPTTFNELLPGVRMGRWDMNVPLFVTPERAAQVTFSLPVWAISDGFLVRAGNPKSLDSYSAVAARHDARLGIITGQVQHESARASGVREEQFVIFEQQSDAINALCSGEIDAYASTAVGNRVLSTRIGGLEFEAVSHETVGIGRQRPPVGAFSFNKGNGRLLDAVNKQLRLYLGSDDHRTRMAKYGLTNNELEPALVNACGPAR
ncbi:amino acid ABC transporter substrate-binding protein [Burkholderia sp. Bp8963]|uniref:transporter substrate-binding domain-containing protein n=1 Tax=Burkholderia sp. Bp8963 TaxID=2184547 RepID=UPI000F598B20|nr:transporter substrate-binding domain-containing protein [Burkholderia sp. Bp8963]RQS62946.1 amino acid ABC transporter substrate-binding protein [Burkholderia sp. Bp8963]